MTALPETLCERIHEGESPLRVWREHRGLSVAELASAAGLAPAYIEKLEGGGGNLKAAQREAIAKALGIATIELTQTAALYQDCAMAARGAGD